MSKSMFSQYINLTMHAVWKFFIQIFITRAGMYISQDQQRPEQEKLDPVQQGKHHG
ncbi:hypothetical protein EC844_13812 [Acinetobacter calcoaceticus]|uniref:Uncharacterized protein n=1 Tax=Acinetobacter calcoaceticus TaxID=471 RepID=A0A4R1XAK2_ACICA|nr:hypothetical protein EC844_13812 [Acinetobacter calcoaceticus]